MEKSNLPQKEIPLAHSPKHQHLTGDKLVEYIKRFDAKNKFVRGNYYEIGGKKVKC